MPPVRREPVRLGPPPPDELRVDVFDEGSPAFGGTALRKQVTVYLSEDPAGPRMDLLIYLPAEGQRTGAAAGSTDWTWRRSSPTASASPPSYYVDIDPDFQGGLPHGVRALYLVPGQAEPAPDEWGTHADRAHRAPSPGEVLVAHYL